MKILEIYKMQFICLSNLTCMYAWVWGQLSSTNITTNMFIAYHIDIYVERICCNPNYCILHKYYKAYNWSYCLLRTTDGQPGNIIASLFTISKHQVSVSWFFISNPNSDPGMIQLQVATALYKLCFCIVECNCKHIPYYITYYMAENWHRNWNLTILIVTIKSITVNTWKYYINNCAHSSNLIFKKAFWNQGSQIHSCLYF